LNYQKIRFLSKVYKITLNHLAQSLFAIYLLLKNKVFYLKIKHLFLTVAFLSLANHSFL